MHCFEPNDDFALQDSKPFKFRHRLLGHPTLEFYNLRRNIPTLAHEHLYFSGAQLRREDDFESSITGHRESTTIEAVMDNLHQSNGYVMVRQPEVLKGFRDLWSMLREDVDETVRARGFGERASEHMLYLFLTSPGNLTPFHFDRQSNFLLQFTGTKTVTIYEPWHEDVITPAEYESHMARTDFAKVQWKEAAEPLGTAFHFEPGDAVHVPFCSGHHVANGNDGVSISLAIFFSHRVTDVRTRALHFNRLVRPLMRRVGASPRPVGKDLGVDRMKASAHGALSTMRSWLKPAQRA